MKTLTSTALLLLALTGCNKDAPATATPAATPATAGTSAQDISNARSFLSHIYAGYHPDAGLDAILPDEEVYTPALIAAMQANSDAYAGEVGYLDGDPLCDCQDTAQDLRQLSVRAWVSNSTIRTRIRAFSVVEISDPAKSISLRSLTIWKCVGWARTQAR